jgi:hypothetical protein
MAHSSHPQEMADAVAWLKQRLPQALPSEPELRAMGNADLKRLAASRFAASATCDARALLPSACKRRCAARLLFAGGSPPLDSLKRRILCVLL